MTAQPAADFLDPGFVQKTSETLNELGFVTDEHDFAPYRETLSVHRQRIELELGRSGHQVRLMSGFLKHAEAGYAYYIYDLDRFPEGEQAERAVSTWLDEKYR